MISSIALTLIAISLLHMMWANPFIGIMAWSWFSYMVPHKYTYGFTFDLQFVFAIAVVTGIAWFRSKRPFPFPAKSPVFIMLAVLFIHTTLTTILAYSFDASFYRWNSMWKILLLAVLTMDLCYTKHRFQVLIYIIALSIGYHAIKGGLFTIVTGGGFRVQGPPASLIADNNILALVMAMSMPLWRYITLEARRLWAKRLAMLIMLLTGVAIIGTHSRGGALSIMMVMLWLFLISKRKLGFLSVIFILSIFSVQFMPQNWKDRMYTTTAYETDDSATGRIQMWHMATKMANDRPLRGFGFAALYNTESTIPYAPEHIPRRATHSIYFQQLMEHGYLGLYIFLMLLFTAMWTTSSVASVAKQYEELTWARHLSNAIQASLVCYMIGGAFLEVVVIDLIYHLMAIAGALHIYVGRKVPELKPKERKFTISGQVRRPESWKPADLTSPAQ